MKKILSILCMICFFQILIICPIFAKEVTETSSYENVDVYPTRIVDERYAVTVRFYNYGDSIPDSIYYEEYVNSAIIYRGTLYKRQVNYLSTYISVVYDGYIYAQL